jgi:CRP-like cAMP-binding protein
VQLHISSEHVSLLRQRGGLGVLTPPECSALLRQARARTLPSGAPLFVQGAPSDEVAWVLQGQAQLIVHGRKGDLEGLRLQAGDVVGQVPFLAQARHQATVRAFTDLAVLVLDRETSQRLRERRDPIYPKLALALGAAACAQVGEIERQLRASGVFGPSRASSSAVGGVDVSPR